LLTNRSGNSAGEVYLVDFGSVQTVAAREGGTMTVVGTYGYMPPEQFGGRAVPASDIYSLGATLIYLVTGTHPADLPQKDFRIEFEPAANLRSSFSRWLRWMCEPSLDRRLSSARAALQALETEQPSTDTAGLVVRKPAGSKIKLTKNADYLEIVVPPVGFQASIVFIGAFATAWNSFVLFWTISVLSAPFPVNIPFALFSLPFWGVGFFMVSQVVSTLFGSLRLRLDRQQIAFYFELLGFKFNRNRPGSTQNITKLIYIPKHLTKDSEGGMVMVPAELIIWVGVQKYQIGGSGSRIQSEIEIEWLAHELSDWLGIPLTRE
jgi:serine/threonine protein kinase